MSVSPVEDVGPMQAILLPIRDEDVPRLIAALEEADAEVAGFAFGPVIKMGGLCGTRCVVTGQQNSPDMHCSDSDR